VEFLAVFNVKESSLLLLPLTPLFFVAEKRRHLAIEASFKTVGQLLQVRTSVESRGLEHTSEAQNT
jgi:hypothetical protein